MIHYLQATFAFMKKYITLVLVLLYASMTHAENVRGTINLESVKIPVVLNLYSQITDKELVIESAVTNQSKFISVRMQAASKMECAKLLEKALLEQADIVITPLDDKRASVKLAKK